MGTHPNISHDKFPTQSTVFPVGTKVMVCFNYDTSHTFQGTILRNDVAEPYLTIINMDDGRTVLSTECMWSPQK